MDSRNTISEHSKLAVTLGTFGHNDHRNISISHGNLKQAATLTFERTLRVPDNQDVNNLPPSLGQFPLFSVAEYKSRMHEDMASKGGVFLPMYQREAMWIRFSAQEPFALKIYVGGVNAISGVPINESPEAMLKRLQLSDKVKQDYVVLPEQPWLDGIASEDGRIRQFVAMPKGSGYSVEAQVTGEEKIGGLQFEITPVKRGCPNTLKVNIVMEDEPVKEKVLNLNEKGLSSASTMLDLKNVIAQDFEIPTQLQGLRLLSGQPGTSGRDVMNNDLTFAEIWISETDVLEIRNTGPTRSQARQKRSTGFGGSFLGGFAASPVPAASYESASLPSLSMAAGPFTKSKKSFMSSKLSSPPPPPAAAQASCAPAPAPAPLKDSAAAKEKSSLRYTAHEEESMDCDDGGEAYEAFKIPAPGAPPAPKVEAMSLAAGGLIKQSINADNFPPSIWDPENSILFNVQLLNSESFFGVTGRAPPSSPIDAKTYAQYGYPFYDIWNEELSGVKGDFSMVKSVGAMDEQLAVDAKGKQGFWDKLKNGNKTSPPPEEFKRDESILFPVIMLDMRRKLTFKPLKEVEEDVRRLKAEKEKEKEKENEKERAGGAVEGLVMKCN